MKTSEPDSFVAAAQYLRKSTVEHQRYSIDNQIAAIGEYAAQKGFQIVQSYMDAGRSGLTFDNRHELKRLIGDVQSGAAPFKAILVYDVSRWGRFQDADESAYYEYACKRAGVRVLYCAEAFGNDGSPMDAVIKGLKRAMAGEYSRELGVKVYAGQKRIIEKGFRLGSRAGYGLRRQLVDENGRPKQLLKPGNRKSISSDRVILVPGPRQEIAVVRGIYRSFIHDGKMETAIARSLNRRGLRNSTGAPWNFCSVHKVLTSPKYAGHNVWNRTTAKLGITARQNPENEWIYSPKKFQTIVSQRTFDRAQEILAKRSIRVTNAELLERLRRLWRKHGRLSARLIDAEKTLPSDGAFCWRFGRLAEAYRLIGYKTDASLAFLEVNRHVRNLRDDVIEQIRVPLAKRGDDVAILKGRFSSLKLLRINDQTTLQVFMMRCRHTTCGYPRWRIHFEENIPGPALAVRMDSGNKDIAAYYFFSEGDRMRNRRNMHESDLTPLEPFRLHKLSELWPLV